MIANGLLRFILLNVAVLDLGAARILALDRVMGVSIIFALMRHVSVLD